MKQRKKGLHYRLIRQCICRFCYWICSRFYPKGSISKDSIRNPPLYKTQKEVLFALGIENFSILSIAVKPLLDVLHKLFMRFVKVSL